MIGTKIMQYLVATFLAGLVCWRLASSKILVATFLGFIAGLVCWRLASSGGPMPASMAWSIILSRTLIGFVIGISAWRINYLAHGILIGLIISIPMAFASGAHERNIDFLGDFDFRWGVWIFHRPDHKSYCQGEKRNTCCYVLVSRLSNLKF